MEESAEFVLIIRAICEWLRACQAAGEPDVTFARLCAIADDQSTVAGQRFYTTYGRYPELTDLPDAVMRLPRAQSIVRLADKTRTMLFPENGEERRVNNGRHFYN